MFTNIKCLFKNDTTSQYEPHFYDVWKDPDVGNLTLTGIPIRSEVDSKRATNIIIFLQEVFFFGRGGVVEYEP